MPTKDAVVTKAAAYNAHVEQRENASISTQVSKPLQIFSGISFIAVLYEREFLKYHSSIKKYHHREPSLYFQIRGRGILRNILSTFLLIRFSDSPKSGRVKAPSVLPFTDNSANAEKIGEFYFDSMLAAFRSFGKSF